MIQVTGATGIITTIFIGTRWCNPYPAHTPPPVSVQQCFSVHAFRCMSFGCQTPGSREALSHGECLPTTVYQNHPGLFAYYFRYLCFADKVFAIAASCVPTHVCVPPSISEHDVDVATTVFQSGQHRGGVEMGRQLEPSLTKGHRMWP